MIRAIHILFLDAPPQKKKTNTNQETKITFPYRHLLLPHHAIPGYPTVWFQPKWNPKYQKHSSLFSFVYLVGNQTNYLFIYLFKERSTSNTLKLKNCRGSCSKQLVHHHEVAMDDHWWLVVSGAYASLNLKQNLVFYVLVQ